MNAIAPRGSRGRAALLAILVAATVVLGVAGTASPAPGSIEWVRPTLAFVQETRTPTSYDAEIYTIDAYNLVTQLTDFRGYSLSPAWSPDGARIAFVRQDTGQTESGIYVMNADGTGVTRLTHGAGGDSNPAWSPDGTKIAFASNRDGDYDIFVMNADGSGVAPVTSNDVDDGHPTWSPDGTKIAFESVRTGVDRNIEIYVIGIDGSGLVNLTQNDDCDDRQPDWQPGGTRIAFVSCGAIKAIESDGSPTPVDLAGGAEPDWSPNGEEFAYTDVSRFPPRICVRLAACPALGSQPDFQPGGNEPPVATGGRIAFSSDRDGNQEIYSIAADGTDEARLTTYPGEDFQPQWSPNGREIAFSRDFKIVRMPAAGGPVTPVTSGPGADLQPTWAPDGRRLAFVSDRTGSLQIYSVDRDGTGVVQLTSAQGFNVDPSWSPDGRSIVFASSRDGNEEIYVMDADGGNQRRLTDDPARDYGPYWSPTGTAIVFQSHRDGNSEIYVMGRGGLGQTRLTHDPDTDTGPAWSPDGTRIAFASNRDGDFEIFTMNVDGSGVTQLTHNTSADRFPDWQRVVSAGADIDPPVLTLPADVTVAAASPAGATVPYAVTAADAVDPAPSVACGPASGSVFPIGVTTVACTATDASGNAASGTFTVTVLGADEQLLDLAQRVAAAGLPSGAGAVLVRLASGFDPSNPAARRVACAALNAFVVVTRAAAGRTIPAATAAEWIADARRIRAVLGC